LDRSLLYLNTFSCLYDFFCSAYWIYWEIVSFIVGQLGTVALSVHAIAGQIIAITFMIPMGYGIAVSIRIGNLLPQSTKRAQIVCCYSLGLGLIIVIINAILLDVLRPSIVALFTRETIVIQESQRIWHKVVFCSFQLGLYAMLAGVFVGLGSQATIGIICIVYLWLILLPMIYYFAILHEGGLNMVWKLMCPMYLLINVTAGIYLIRIDWETIAQRIKQREGDLNKREGEIADPDDNVPVIRYGSV
jgi:multidrug resistance protein, MATE family